MENSTSENNISMCQLTLSMSHEDKYLVDKTEIQQELF